MKNTYNKTIYVLLFILFTGFNAEALLAQDETITDEEIQTYVVAMDSVEEMKSQLKTDYNELVKSNELMKGGKRFKEIMLAGDDEEKLKEMSVTEEELAAYREIQAQYEQWKAEFKEKTNAVITEVVGVSLYNKIRKGMKANAELKARYEQILAEYMKKKSEKENPAME